MCEDGWIVGVVACGLRALRCFHTWRISLCVQNGKSVVSGSTDRTVLVWDLATGKEVQKLKGHFGVVTSVAFSSVGGVELARVLRA